ncbi:MAG: hypothetical protein GY714_33060 [Desulfobacterales bacterium]|nr:hypothetical protein [Desulfobacterales bacterium]
MGLVGLSLGINGLITLMYLDELGEFGIIMVGYWLFSLITSIAYSQTKNKVLGVLAFIGFAGYIPIGLIGVFGIRKMMDEEKRNEVIAEERRNQKINKGTV